MKNYWTQPSLSRDFTFLAAAVLFVLFVISVWITYSTYSHYSKEVAVELEREAQIIEHTLATEMENASYLLSALGKQFVLDEARTPLYMAGVLKSFDSKGFIYSILSWVNTEQKVIVSSNKGVLDTPVDISDRDYVKKATSDPWKMQIGRPIEGRVSERWVIPVSMGITDYTGKFIGTVMLSIDINTLSEHLSRLIKKDGISFAIVSKTLIPLTQVSEDKNFVTNNFPTQKLVNVNFSDSPSGLLTYGSLFWGAGNYAYYKTSADYPYIILLGYDAARAKTSARDILASRLLQIVLIASFLIAILWIMRTRMIKPVVEMTALAAAVARGEHNSAMRVNGPVEVNALAGEVKRIGEYIAETKRIESELRNKVFMLKKAKEKAETDRRSKTEFLAYVCQEMRTALNNIIGFSQVMRDQLYGPIENRKYRQYSADIYKTGNTLLSHMQDLLTLSKIETGYVDLIEKPQDVASVINKVLRFIADKLQSENMNVRLKLQEPLPRIIADEFRLQQMLMNLMLHMLQHMLPDQTLTLEAKLISEGKEKPFFVFILSNDSIASTSNAELLRLVETLQNTPRIHYDQNAQNRTDLCLELAKSLVELHHGYMDIQWSSTNNMTIKVFFTNSRIMLGEEK
ncbi:MAG: cache domain-containing protein [Alphaproteobacteria bacterium]